VSDGGAAVNIEAALMEWWPQITTIILVVVYLQRAQTRMEVRIEQLERKVEALFELWNKHIDRLLDKYEGK